MNFLKKSCFIVLFLACASCSSHEFDYADLSDFEIDYNSLKNHDTVEVIAYSGGPDYNEKKTYYYHYIVVSKSTGDTVRVLDLSRHSFEKFGTKTKIFIAANSVGDADRLMLKFSGEEKPERVVYNKEFPMEVKAKYPTTIGTFVELSNADALNQELPGLDSVTPAIDSILQERQK